MPPSSAPTAIDTFTVGGSTAAVKGKAASDAVQYTAGRAITRTDTEAPRDVVTGAFVLPTPAAGRVSVGQKPTLTGDVVVYTVSSVKPGEFKPEDVATIRKLAQTNAAAEIETYVNAMRAKAKISIGSTLFD